MIVGDYTYGQENLSVTKFGNSNTELKIGKFCSIGNDVKIILGGNHRTDWITTYPFGGPHNDVFHCTPSKGTGVTKGDIVIGNDVWIGAHAVIVSGVTVGDGSIIGAGSVVTKDVEPYVMVGGGPARVVKKRFNDAIVAKLLILKWWELPVESIRSMVEDLTSEPTVELLDSLIAKYRS